MKIDCKLKKIKQDEKNDKRKNKKRSRKRRKEKKKRRKKEEKKKKKRRKGKMKAPDEKKGGNDKGDVGKRVAGTAEAMPVEHQGDLLLTTLHSETDVKVLNGVLEFKIVF